MIKQPWLVMLRTRRCAGILLAALIASSFVPVEAQAGTIWIDQFTTPTPAPFPPTTLGAGSDPSLVLTEVNAGILGGQRDVLFNVKGIGAPNSLVATVGHDSIFNLDAMQVGTNGNSPTITTVQYSGANALNTATSLVNAHAINGLSTFDITQGGANDRFLINFISCDANGTAGLNVDVIITSPGGKSSTAAVLAQNLLAAFTLPVPFSSLVGDADATQVDSITFVFNQPRLPATAATSNIDFGVSGLLIVPEPTGLALFALGFGMLFGRVLRTRRTR